MNKTRRCLAVTSNGKQCKRLAIGDKPYCSLHIKISPYVSLNRRKLSRKDIFELIKKNGGSNGLDLSFTDLSDLKLGSSVEKMPPFDGAVFGKYGDILSGIIAERIIFVRNSFKKAKLIYANLRGTNFFMADLSQADLRFVDFTDSTLAYTNLSGANLFGTKLIDANMRYTNLHGADLYRTVLSGRTELTKENIGEYILQEDEREYTQFIQENFLADSNNPIEFHLEDRFLKAARIHENLRVHFDSNGNTTDANWAFLKERRMKKKWHGKQSMLFLQQRNWRKSIESRLKWLSDWFVELLCDYGESVRRVVAWLLALIFIIGPVSLFLSGGLVWNGSNVGTYYSLKDGLSKFLYSYFQDLLYMLDTITTANFSELNPTNDITRLISGLMASIGIFLLGLLGFVAGNRIRHS